MAQSTSFISRNLTFYERIKPMNPVDSYTVLATINDLSESKNLIALATGTQANLKVYSDDIEDCHAESIVKRAYKRHVIDRLIDLGPRCDNRADFRELVSKELVGDQSLVLFISQFPCGFNTRYQGEDPVDENTGEKIKRKPGRGKKVDGHMIYVTREPCFDKIKRWLVDGLQGKRLETSFGIRRRISKILIGNCEPDETYDYEKNLKKFRQTILEIDEKVEIELADGIRSEQFVYDGDKQPQPESVAYWAPASYRNSNGEPIVDTKCTEFIVDGRKRGLTKRLIERGLNGNKLKISNYCLNKDMDYLESLFSG